MDRRAFLRLVAGLMMAPGISMAHADAIPEYDYLCVTPGCLCSLWARALELERRVRADILRASCIPSSLFEALEER